MKNVINLSLFEKPYYVSLLVYQMQHLKRSKEFSLKFLIPLSFDIFAI